MAIQNYLTNYVPAEDTSGVPEASAYQGHGVRESYFHQTVSILSTDNATSTYTIIKNIPAEAVIAKLDIETDALTSGTSYSIGIFDSVTGVAYAATCYLVAQTLASASTKNAPLDGILALTHDQTLQPVYVLAGHTLLNKRANYDLVLTANTPSSVTGSVTFRGHYVPAG